MNIAEYASHDGLGLAELVRRRAVSPRELAQAALTAIEQVNPSLNAVIEVFQDRAEWLSVDAPTAGPFAGVPFLLKDLFLFEKGALCECGSELLRGFRPGHDSELTRRFRQAGFVTLGRTATPEMGYSSATSSRLSGITRNPWNLDRSPGGSSGGAAAAVAAGIVPIAHGSDGGGSIRSPSCFNGLVGLKPSRGRISEGPDAGDLLGGLGVNFALTRSVRDCAALLDAVHGAASGDPYGAEPPNRPFLAEVGDPVNKLRVAVAPGSFSGVPVDPAVADAVERTAKLLESMGHRVERDMPRFDWENFLGGVNDLWTAHLAYGCDALGTALKRTPSQSNLQAVTWACYRHGKSLSATQLLAAMDQLNLASRRIAAFFETYDLLVTPTCTRPWIGQDEFDMTRSDIDALQWAKKCFALEVFLVPFNVTGQPAISLPLEKTADNFPVGIQFVARARQESLLFRLAGALEAAVPWAARRPPLHAGSPSLGSNPR